MAKPWEAGLVEFGISLGLLFLKGCLQIPHPPRASLLVKPASPASGLLIKNQEALDVSALHTRVSVLSAARNLGLLKYAREFLKSWRQFQCRQAGFSLFTETFLLGICCQITMLIVNTLPRVA